MLEQWSETTFSKNWRKAAFSSSQVFFKRSLCVGVKILVWSDLGQRGPVNASISVGRTWEDWCG